jgi:hypothetical protein
MDEGIGWRLDLCVNRRRQAVAQTLHQRREDIMTQLVLIKKLTTKMKLKREE